MTLGIVINPYAMNVPDSLINAARNFPIRIRTIHLPSLMVKLDKNGEALVSDKDGVVAVNCLAPYLLFGFPVSVIALRILSQKAYLQNPVDSVLIADDKAAASERLVSSGIPQVPTFISSSDLGMVLSIVAEIGYPVVLKRTHGALGRWVRNAVDEVSLRLAHAELMTEGPTALIIQPQILEAKGKSIRAVITGGRVLAVTERIAVNGEWRSNIANGAVQRPVDLGKPEYDMVLSAAKTLGLRHAGIDLLKTSAGYVILEVNSCPDYTSMIPYFTKNLTNEVLNASISKLGFGNKDSKPNI